MPGKSRRQRGKHLTKSKKGEGGVSRSTLTTQSTAATPVQRLEPALPPERPVSSVSRATQPAKPVAQHPYITAELLTIGFLAGIMLIILVVLASVLP